MIYYIDMNIYFTRYNAANHCTMIGYYNTCHSHGLA